ncbi:MAG: hypothetical protein DMG88_18305 [Acidobacteria bacterium]|nr:MAG: hypothetical protein DMG88_18305 [Acidobacteriota bacterium]
MAQWVGNLILLFALFAAIWYAWETRKMRLQMIRPKLVFLTAPHPPAHMDDSASVDLFLRNVGDGVALNVLVQRSEDNKFKLRFEPEHIPILQKQEQVLLTIRPAEGHYQPDMKLILNDRSISLKIVASYVDVEGREFRTSTAVGGAAKPPFIRDERA